MAHALFVFGPAGTGKSTFTKNVFEYGEVTGRRFIRLNLDPAQQTDFEIDITDYITVNEIMEELDYGPNGGLVYALQEFLDNIEEIEEIQGIKESDDYLIIDCPGQIELFSHSDEMFRIVEYFKQYFKCCIVYLIEAQYILDAGKYLAACLNAMICMMRFSVPHIGVITKIDLLGDKANMLEDEMYEGNVYLYPDKRVLDYVRGNKKYVCFNEKIAQMLEDNNLVQYTLVNWEKEDMIIDLMYSIDEAVEYHDDREPKESFK
ncbi:hypothetical protein EDEG_01087 [Edhazardia aedis USNM 41457]|uniref:GPN-loop GTPase 3 n=1 Tax=Edhazardia aedis (strain USNM 41457) TaxID=1003232 RepID=J9DB53_EDHAE|nr:hypothetical protein EDEG_01087 [Edhazardia aedis USNM 41457]|eukprot:EJW04724.1 hypothetical protein EDEG_01087 [Edhazardia aedis USNM 41457]